MTVPTLALLPSIASYNAIDTSGTRTVRLQGAASLFAKRYKNATLNLTVQWDTNGHGYRYLRAFYKTGVMKGCWPFICPLIFPASVRTLHKSMFFGPLQLYAIDGTKYTIQATIEAERKAHV